ncbi:hypothetical protein C9M02_19960 [Salmonella enterica subsp. enterica serovar Enteritidis]|nr:hypothetical protein [Salmonella enterica subsp. enterica serovar Enteritidis]
MRAPTASEVAGQFNSNGGTQISASQVSNIRSDGNGGYSANIKGQTHTVSYGGESHTSNTVGGFSGVPTSGHSNGNHNSGSGGGKGGVNTDRIVTHPAKVKQTHPCQRLARNVGGCRLLQLTTF